MPVPTEISFHGIEPGDMLRRRVEEQAERLERYDDDIIGARVTVEGAHAHGHKKILEVHVEISLEGKTVFAKREAQYPEPQGTMGYYTAVSDAFDAAMRQMDEFLTRRRRDVKTHEGANVYGRVVRLNRANEHGFIETPEGHNLFFHRAVVADDDYDRLTEGSEVVYDVAEAEGAYGPQARSVKLRQPGV
jgi:ribosome-associated translation inhibitor RaiA